MPTLWRRSTFSTPGTKEREASLKTLINRVVDTVVRQGKQEGYFTSDEEAETYREELNTFWPRNGRPLTAQCGLTLALKSAQR